VGVGIRTLFTQPLHRLCSIHKQLTMELQAEPRPTQMRSGALLAFHRCGHPSFCQRMQPDTTCAPYLMG
jgi:hypothetical protein